MSWWALDIQSPETTREAVAAWLVGRTGQAVEQRPDGVLVAGVEGRAASAVLAELQQAFGEAVQSTARALPERDWSKGWRHGLGPRRIGRLVVSPSWSIPENAKGPLVVIDPETAFGTGDHGSTRTALLLLDRFVRPGDRVLDLGSGSGILAIAAVKLGARRAVGVDVDPETEPVARHNADRNGVAPRVAFVTGDAATLAVLLGPVELVVSNILRNENERLLAAIRSALGPGGLGIFAGMERSEADEFRAALRRYGFTSGAEVTDDDWWGVAAARE